MKSRHIMPVLALAIVLLCPVSISCGSQQDTYDPAKTYAAVIAIDLPTARASMDDIRQKSAAEGYEVGPIVYYQLGYTDFVSLVKNITSQAHIGLLWVASGLDDVQRIQDAIATAGYMGQTRLVPIYAPSPYHP